jgi:hypothetical protein
MPVVTLQATNNVNSGMSSPSNNGHGSSNVVWSDPPTGSQNKSINWDTFPGVPGRVIGVRLKLDWTRTAVIGGNGSTNWTILIGGEAAIFELNNVASGSGSVDFAMVSPPTTLTGLVVADFISASVFVGGFGGSASLTTQISNVRIDVTYVNSAQPIVLN